MKLNLHFYKRLCLLSCFLFALSEASIAQTTASIYATGTTGSFNTGSVNVSGVKFDGNIDSVSIGNAAVPITTAFRGWARFDLSSIPAGATITSANLYFTTYNGSTSSGALNTITGFTGSPNTATGATLYNDIGVGTIINSSAWTANGLQTQPLNAAGITFLQTNVGNPVNVGFMRAGYLAYHIYGYPATAANQPRLDITYTVSNQCATITSVTATGPSSICAGTSFTLASATLPAAAGFTFQWQSSPAGTNTWTNISGATSSTYSGTQSTATDYRLLVTCPATSATGTSNTVAIAQTNFNTCYCPATVGYVLNDEITNVLLGTINNSTTCASLVGSQGTAVGGADIYSDFTGSTVPIPGLMQGISQTLSVDLSSCGAASTTREVKAYIDYDQNGLFTDPGEEIIVYPHGNPNSAVYTASVNFTVPATATLGNTRMRILLGQGLGSIASPCSVYLSYGEAEDYTVNIVQSVPCSGIPTAGIASGPASVCSGLNFNLSVAIGTVGTGLNIQWESSPAGTNTWTAISGATSASYTVTGGQTAATDYRAVVTCVNGGGMDVSNTVAVAMSPFYLCYCSPNNGVSLNGTNSFNYLTNVSIPNTTINNSNTTGGYVMYYPTTASTTDTLFQGIQYTINTTHAYSGSYNSFAWIDYDASGTFDASEYIALTTNNLTGTATFIVPFSATPGLTGMRIRHYFGAITAASACSVNGSYETEDYIIQIGTSPQCAGIPVAGAASGPATSCSGINFNLNLTGYTIGQGIDIEWQMYDVATSTWVAMTGGTTPVFTVTGGQVAATDYRAKVTCINGGGTDYSNTVSVGMSSFFLCYCSPNTGVSLNGTNTFNYLTNTTLASTTLNNSSNTGGYSLYYPTTANSTASLVQGAQYTINTTHTYSGAPYNSFLWIDYDGNGTFDASEYTALTTTGLSGTATFMVPVAAVPGQTGMRVRHYWGTITAGNACSVNGSYETEDYVITIVATTPCVGTPNSAVVTGPANACAATPFTLTASGYTIGSGISFQWEFFNTATSTWDPIPGASTSPTLVVANQIAATDYRFTTMCANGGGTSVSNTLSVGQNPASQCYCTPLYTSACNSGDDIDDVILVGDVAPGINNLNTPCPASGYLDYTTTSASLTPGLLYSGNVTTNYTGASEDVNIWIDYNLNGVFETAESVATIDNISNLSTGAFSFTVPTSTLPGPYRMRVRLVYGQTAASGIDPCISYTWGETHDYSVLIGFPLAVKLSSITATNVGSRNRVDWNTEFELKDDKFEVERSTDGRNFTYLSMVYAKGGASAYSYWDETPVTGTNYYRLKMIDATGSLTHSKVVTANVKAGVFTVEAYPNPVSDILTVKVYGIAAVNATVAITDVTGKVLQVATVENNQASISTGSLAPGTYLVKYTDNNHTQTIKVNKQ